jgi:hypothetical protein
MSDLPEIQKSNNWNILLEYWNISYVLIFKYLQVSSWIATHSPCGGKYLVPAADAKLVGILLGMTPRGC